MALADTRGRDGFWDPRDRGKDGEKLYFWVIDSPQCFMVTEDIDIRERWVKHIWGPESTITFKWLKITVKKMHTCVNMHITFPYKKIKTSWKLASSEHEIRVSFSE